MRVRRIYLSASPKLTVLITRALLASVGKLHSTANVIDGVNLTLLLDINWLWWSVVPFYKRLEKCVTCRLQFRQCREFGSEQRRWEVGRYVEDMVVGILEGDSILATMGLGDYIHRMLEVVVAEDNNILDWKVVCCCPYPSIYVNQP